MPYDYGDYYYEMEETGLSMVLGFYLIYFLLMLAISVGTYVLQSLGMYTIAKRRGINNPWLAWLPVGSAWILGCISDQYRYVTKGQVKNKRKALLILQIVMLIGAFVAVFAAVVGIIQMIPDMSGDMHQEGMRVAGGLLLMLGTWIVLVGVEIAVMVIYYMALYDLYHSCEPKNGTLYLVLSIFVNITQPIFLFLCRNKDEGMPPRRPQPESIPQPPAEPWQPAEPPKEPWENNPEA